jgi:anti-anti-sigma regulatory factor/PAS domain-containing protein
MNLHERVAAFDLLNVPIWVFDSERRVMAWANVESVALWGAESREALLARDFTNASDAVRARWVVINAKIAQGQTVREQFTFYPRGVPLTLGCSISAIALDDGRTAMLVRAEPEASVDPALVRGIEALRHTSAVIALLAQDGAILMRNPASIRAFGEEASLSRWIDDAEVRGAILATGGAGEIFVTELVLRTLQGERWYAIEARGTQDPATGAAAVLLQMLDTTEQRDMARAIARQRRLIRGLSVPILNLGPKTLAVPLIGELDEERGALVAEQLLPAIVAKGAQNVIVDLTGLEEVDRRSVEQLVQIIRAVGLLGARPILTGARADLARKMVDMQVELGGVRILRDLRAALREVEAILHQTA